MCLAAALCAQGISVPGPVAGPGRAGYLPWSGNWTPFSYDEEEAKMMASLSSVSYCHNEQQILDWTCQPCKDSKTPMAPGKVRVIDAGSKNATRIIVGKLKDQPGCLLAFRGSSNPTNWLRDFQISQVGTEVFDHCQGCKVHSGYLNIWKNVQDEVMRGLRDVGCEEGGADELIYVTGHSLGAGMSHIAMFALHSAGFKVAKTYTFEGPRTGNKAFADAFSDAFSRKFPVYRITHHYDPVVHMPFKGDYYHVDKEVYYDGNGKYKVCAEMEDESCANQFWDVPALVLFHADDHCNSPLVPNGNICMPVGCEDPEDPQQVMV